MTDNEKINGWTFEETVKTAENLMEAESNMFKWDVLRHLRDFAESYKDKVQAFEAIGTVEEFKALKEKSVAKKAIGERKHNEAYCPVCNELISDGEFWALNEYVHHCNKYGQSVKGVDWR